MHSVLITGGAGFIGQNLVHTWSSARPEDRVVVLDALTYAANIRSLEPLIADRRVSFVKGDIAFTLSPKGKKTTVEVAGTVDIGIMGWLAKGLIGNVNHAMQDRFFGCLESRM